MVASAFPGTLFIFLWVDGRVYYLSSPSVVREKKVVKNRDPYQDAFAFDDSGSLFVLYKCLARRIKLQFS